MFKHTLFIALLLTGTQITLAMKVERIQLSPEIYRDIKKTFRTLLEQKRSAVAQIKETSTQDDVESPLAKFQGSETSKANASVAEQTFNELITPKEFENNKKPRTISGKRVLRKSPKLKNQRQLKSERENNKRLFELLTKAQQDAVKEAESSIEVINGLLKKLEDRKKLLGQ